MLKLVSSCGLSRWSCGSTNQSGRDFDARRESLWNSWRQATWHRGTCVQPDSRTGERRCACAIPEQWWVSYTLAARDGSWTTGSLEPAMFAYVTFDQSGMIIHHCPDHPWAIGEVTVEAIRP